MLLSLIDTKINFDHKPRHPFIDKESKHRSYCIPSVDDFCLRHQSDSLRRALKPMASNGEYRAGHRTHGLVNTTWNEAHDNGVGIGEKIRQGENNNLQKAGLKSTYLTIVTVELSWNLKLPSTQGLHYLNNNPRDSLSRYDFCGTPRPKLPSSTSRGMYHDTEMFGSIYLRGRSSTCNVVPT